MGIGESRDFFDDVVVETTTGSVCPPSAKLGRRQLRRTAYRLDPAKGANTEQEGILRAERWLRDFDQTHFFEPGSVLVRGGC